ncbi:hypothetical protein SLEP1_g13338 [Rubroshorea leprosula]|uniref:Uncharacterized protein n=1 Tax=Rubroshorea leprosula TaxID=152421 RepID=A0AAV5IQX4_9ROSI|nr:hypothetical protein SLEP1_g13338 [Rubroshorea leprosula]
MFKSNNVAARIFERQIRTPAPGTSVNSLAFAVILFCVALPSCLFCAVIIFCAVPNSHFCSRH